MLASSAERSADTVDESSAVVVSNADEDVIAAVISGDELETSTEAAASVC